MKNNILDISTHALDLSTDLVNAPDAIEFGIPCELARLLVKDLGELERASDVEMALINMWHAGILFKRYRAAAWVVIRNAPGKVDDGVKLGPFWKDRKLTSG